MSKVIYREFITRSYVKAHPNYLFLFGDNLATFGLQGQAKEMRGESNAIGIATKIYPDTRNTDYLDDIRDWDTMIYYYNLTFIGIRKLSIRYDKIIIPKKGLGTGLSKMQEKCPKILAYLNQKLKELEEL